MVRPRTAVAPPATTIYGKPSAIQTISDMRSCGNGWATILIRRPFRSMTSTRDSHPCSAAGPRIRTREPCSSSGRLGYAGLPKAHEVARVFRAQQLLYPRTGSYDHARGRVPVSVGPHRDRAMHFLMEVENDLRGEDLRAQLSRQIELRLDASLGTKKSRATLEVTNFIAAQSELRIAATDFIGVQNVVRNAEFPGRADGVLDERG